MKIYFVRHGSTDSLEKRISQPNDEPLNERGIAQAKQLAERFKNEKLDLVISSPHLRAVQTAEEISKKMIISELFGEVKKPKEIIGVAKEEDEVKNIKKKIGEMYVMDPSWHYSDEENFEDLKTRGLAALEFLKAQNKENILVVSHGSFMGFMVALMMFGETLTLEMSLKMKNFFRLGNTGVSICVHDEGKWKLQCWNDTSHLLE
jgi:broad specificity phosphatase PhoE